MRDNMSDSNETVDAEQPGSPPRQNWRELLSKYRQPIGLAVMLLLFSLALIACRHMLVEMDWYALHDSLFAVPLPALGGALLAAIVGYVILMGYELSASRYANVSSSGSPRKVDRDTPLHLLLGATTPRSKVDVCRTNSVSTNRLVSGFNCQLNEGATKTRLLSTWSRKLLLSSTARLTRDSSLPSSSSGVLTSSAVR